MPKSKKKLMKMYFRKYEEIYRKYKDACRKNKRYQEINKEFYKTNQKLQERIQKLDELRMENSNLINELYKKNKQEEKHETIIRELWKQV